MKIRTQLRFLVPCCLVAAAAAADPSTGRGEWPSYGADWGGAAFDRETGILYVPAINRPILSKLAQADSSRTNFRYMRTSPRDVPGIEGLPLFKPPYSTVTAVDLNRGENLWTVPIGDGPIEHPLLKSLNLPPLGSGGRGYPLITKTLLPLRGNPMKTIE